MNGKSLRVIQVENEQFAAVDEVAAAFGLTFSRLADKAHRLGVELLAAAPRMQEVLERTDDDEVWMGEVKKLIVAARQLRARDTSFRWPGKHDFALVSTMAETPAAAPRQFSVADLKEETFPGTREPAASAAGGGGFLHPAAEVLTEVAREKNVREAFSKVESALWPRQGGDLPDELTRMLVMQSAVREATRLLDERMSARRENKGTRRKDWEGLPLGMREALEEATEQEMLDLVFGGVDVRAKKRKKRRERSAPTVDLDAAIDLD